MASTSTSQRAAQPKSSRPSGSRRKGAPSALHVSADPEIMASLVESLSKIAPSPHHSLVFEGPPSALLSPAASHHSGYSSYPASPLRDFHLLHPEDAAQPPVIKTSKAPETNSKRSSYAPEVPNYTANFMTRSESEDDIMARSQLSAEKVRGQMGFATPPLSPIDSIPRPIPIRNSSYGKGTSPVREEFSREQRRHSVQPTLPPVLKSSLSSPTSPTHKSMKSSRTSVSLKRQSSLPQSQANPPTLHKRSASGRLRRLSSPPTITQTLPTPTIIADDRSIGGDSIDDAVEAYLLSPRLSQKLRFPNTGRVISFSEVGDPNGYAVFVCVGMGLTRYITAFYDDLALSLGLRLITPDRPGVGESEPIPENERSVLSWPDDILYICQSLKITKFSIMAHSAGAIYALATALRMPGHIRGKIHLLAPWIPPSQMTSIGHPQGECSPAAVPTSQRILRALPTPILKAANSSFMSATSSSLTSSLPKSPNRKKRASAENKRASKDGAKPSDKPQRMSISADVHLELTSTGDMLSPTIKSPSDDDDEERNSTDAILSAALSSAAEKERQMTYDERLTHAIWALATRNANPAVDLLVCLERSRPIGFRYVDITRAVIMHHGTKDNRVPVDNVKWLGTTMRRCEVRILQDEGHGLMASAKVMGDVLTEIAAEWREWRRAMEDKGMSQQKNGMGWGN